MITSFRDQATADLFHGRRTRRVRAFPPDILDAAVRKLDLLNAAHLLSDLSAPPGNHLEALKRDLAGYHSIRVNRQWRIVFVWQAGNATDVGLMDYH